MMNIPTTTSVQPFYPSVIEDEEDLEIMDDSYDEAVEELAVHQHPGEVDQAIIKDGEEDYEFSRKTIKELIEKSMEAIDSMSGLASEAESPNAFSILSGMISNAASMTNSLMGLQQQRKKLREAPRGSRNGPGAVNGDVNTTNNTVFVGSTSELQKFLKEQKALETQDAVPQ